jgi:hypothetical protein
MRAPRVLPVIAIIAIASVAVTSAVQAQGFFDTLFGGGGNHSVPQATRPLTMPLYGHRAPLFVPQQARERDRDRDRTDPGEAKGSRYRTLCVRLCDGYYWPILLRKSASSSFLS